MYDQLVNGPNGQQMGKQQSYQNSRDSQRPDFNSRQNSQNLRKRKSPALNQMVNNQQYLEDKRQRKRQNSFQSLQPNSKFNGPYSDDNSDFYPSQCYSQSEEYANDFWGNIMRRSMAKNQKPPHQKVKILRPPGHYKPITQLKSQIYTPQLRTYKEFIHMQPNKYNQKIKIRQKSKNNYRKRIPKFVPKQRKTDTFKVQYKNGIRVLQQQQPSKRGSRMFFEYPRKPSKMLKMFDELEKSIFKINYKKSKTQMQ